MKKTILFLFAMFLMISANAQTAASAKSGIGGSGTVGYIPKFSAAKTLTNSSIFQTGSVVDVLGTKFTSTSLNLLGDNRTYPGEIYCATVYGNKLVSTEILFHGSGFSKIYETGTYGITALVGGGDNFIISGGDAVINGVRIGRGAGSFVDNTVLGSGALASNIIGTHNVAIGKDALLVTNNYFNTAVGWSTLSANTGERNSAFGYGSLGVTTSGARNTGLGMFTGNVNATGSDNIFIGYNANPSTSNLTNAIAIGSQSIVESSNSIVLGNYCNAIISHTDKGLVLKSPNGHYWKTQISDAGVLSWVDLGTTY